MNRRKLTLAILLVIFVVAVVSSFLRRPRQQTVAKLKYTSGIKVDASRTAVKTQDDKKLRLDLLDKEPPRFSGFHRNIFRTIFTMEMKPPPNSLNAGKPVLPVPPPPPPPPPYVEPPPAQKAMEDVAQFTFLGFLQKENRKIIFLSRDHEIILVRKGDKIAGKYEVTGITDDALTINLLATGEHIVVPLIENKALKRP
jgi:hypothetical protein